MKFAKILGHKKTLLLLKNPQIQSNINNIFIIIIIIILYYSSPDSNILANIDDASELMVALRLY